MDPKSESAVAVCPVFGASADSPPIRSGILRYQDSIELHEISRAVRPGRAQTISGSVREKCRGKDTHLSPKTIRFSPYRHCERQIIPINLSTDRLVRRGDGSRRRHRDCCVVEWSGGRNRSRRRGGVVLTDPGISPKSLEMVVSCRNHRGRIFDNITRSS